MVGNHFPNDFDTVRHTWDIKRRVFKTLLEPGEQLIVVVNTGPIDFDPSFYDNYAEDY